MASFVDPFAILRSAAAEAIVTPDTHPDLFAGSEPINAADPAVAAAPVTLPAVAVSESVLESAILALESRLAVLETIAKRNGWNL